MKSLQNILISEPKLQQNKHKIWYLLRHIFHGPRWSLCSKKQIIKAKFDSQKANEANASPRLSFSTHPSSPPPEAGPVRLIPMRRVGVPPAPGHGRDRTREAAPRNIRRKLPVNPRAPPPTFYTFYPLIHTCEHTLVSPAPSPLQRAARALMGSTGWPCVCAAFDCHLARWGVTARPEWHPYPAAGEGRDEAGACQPRSVTTRQVGGHTMPEASNGDMIHWQHRLFIRIRS